MIEIVLAFLIGMLIGSFLNVCVYRMPRDLSVVAPRSFCPACEHPIAWFDNIPVLSYALLRGRCRKCRARISLRYPIVELLTGTAFAFAVGLFGVTMPAAKLALFSAILITLIVSDLEERILPDEYTIGGIIAGIAIAWWVPLFGVINLLAPLETPLQYISVAEAAFSAAFSGGVIWFVGWAYEKIRHREGLGFGDVKMIAMIGAFLGLQGALLTLLFGSLAGSIVGLAYIKLTGKDAATYELPFGSFLGIAAAVVALLGELVLGWYPRFGAQ